MYPLNGILSDFFVRFLNKEEYQVVIKTIFTKATLRNDIVACFTDLNLYKPANKLANGPI